MFGNSVDAGEEFEVFGDRQVVVERKLLRHVADLLPYLRGTKAAALAGQLHAAAGGREQAAEHLDGGGLARAIRAQQAVDLAVPHLGGDVLHSRKRAEMFGEIGSADGNLAAESAAVAAAGKRLGVNQFSEASAGPRQRCSRA